MATALSTATKSLEDLFLKELEGIYDAECRSRRMLSATAAAASCWRLKKSILAHLAETEGHVIKLEMVFACFSGKVTGRTSPAIVGLVEQGAEITSDFAGSPAINAALIAFLLKVEHYEIAVYTCLRDWALFLGHLDAADLIEEILEEEQSASQTFTEIALSTSIEEAHVQSAWESPGETRGFQSASG